MPHFAVRNIKHGFFVNRLKNCNSEDKQYRMLSMQEISYFEGSTLSKPKPSYINVSDEDFDRVLVANRDDVVLGRTMSKAIVIDEDLEGCLINSNFILIELTDHYTPYFVAWYINESRDFKKYLSDSDLQTKANLISYDRVGYGIFDTGNVQESIKFEVEINIKLIEFD